MQSKVFLGMQDRSTDGIESRCDASTNTEEGGEGRVGYQHLPNIFLFFYEGILWRHDVRNYEKYDAKGRFEDGKMRRRRRGQLVVSRGGETDRWMVVDG